MWASTIAIMCLAIVQRFENYFSSTVERATLCRGTTAMHPQNHIFGSTIHPEGRTKYTIVQSQQTSENFQYFTAIANTF